MTASKAKEGKIYLIVINRDDEKNDAHVAKKVFKPARIKTTLNPGLDTTNVLFQKLRTNTTCKNN